MSKKLKDSGVLFRRFNSNDDIEELTGLLNLSYKSLADSGLKFIASHQNSTVTKNRISNGVCLIALQAGRIVGTITYYSSNNTKGSLWLNKSNVSSFGQFAVKPHLQSLGIGNELMRLVEKLAVEEEVANIALDTAENAHHLIKYYNKKGYEFVEYVQWPDVNYRSVIMNKVLKVK